MFLLDTTSDMAKCIEEKNLQGKDYALIDEDTVNRMKGIWSDAKDDLKEADRRLLETGGVIAGNATVTDERVKIVLSFLEGCNTIPEMSWSCYVVKHVFPKADYLIYLRSRWELHLVGILFLRK